MAFVSQERGHWLAAGKAEEAGMSSKRLALAGRLLEEETRSGRVLAASMVVARRGVVVLQGGWGRLGPDPASPPAGPDTPYLVASITKPVTATALMLLVERGLVSLADPVSKYLPEFQGADRAAVRVSDLLSHTSGLPDMLPENIELRRANAPLGEFVRRTFTTPLLYRPGTSFSYQSMGILLAAEIVERLSGMPLRQFEKGEIFDPLGMHGTSLGLGGRDVGATAWCQGAPSFEENPGDRERFGANSRYWRDMGHPWGGMHSTARDLAIFLEMFLDGGSYGNVRILAPASVQAMTTDSNAGLAAPWGLGWGLRRSRAWSFFGDLGSDRTFGHVGATGTVAWADPERRLLCVVLTTRPAQEDGGSLLNRVSNLVHAAVEPQ